MDLYTLIEEEQDGHGRVRATSGGGPDGPALEAVALIHGCGAVTVLIVIEDRLVLSSHILLSAAAQCLL